MKPWKRTWMTLRSWERLFGTGENLGDWEEFV